MGKLEFSRYIFSVIFLCALLIALLSRFLIRIELLPKRYLKEDLILRHRSSGQLALVAFILIYLTIHGRFNSLPLIQKGVYLLHNPLLTICGISRLRMIWGTQKVNGISRSNLLVWWLTILLIGFVFFIFCYGMVVRQLPIANLGLEGTVNQLITNRSHCFGDNVDLVGKGRIEERSLG
jgi:hypothetical protein